MTQPNSWTVLSSQEDASVNHILPDADGGMWEARWVQRTHDYGIVYLSSHTGCALSCRFCHLTATGQTQMTPATPSTYLAQARQALSTYTQRVKDGMPKAERLHFNFMSRGDALENPYLLKAPHSVFEPLGLLANQHNLDAHFLVSSILPRSLDKPLSEILADQRASLYYSLYSLSPSFRKRWLPKALPGEEGLDRCVEYQRNTGQKINLHWAFIEGQNDSEKDVDDILQAVHDRQLKAKFNLVRYNPHDQRHGVEPGDARLQYLFGKIQQSLGDQESRIVPRVGHDVKASCGMFVENI